MPAASSDDSLFHEVALTLFPGVGPQLTRQLMSYLGSAKAVLTAPPGRLHKVPGVGAATVAALSSGRSTALSQAEATLRRAGR